MSDLHAMPITNITQSAWRHTVKLSVSPKILHVSHFTTIVQPRLYAYFVCRGSSVCVSKITCRNWCNHHHQRMQPLLVLKIKMVQPLSRPYFSFAIITFCGNQIHWRSTGTILKSRSKIQDCVGYTTGFEKGGGGFVPQHSYNTPQPPNPPHSGFTFPTNANFD